MKLSEIGMNSLNPLQYLFDVNFRKVIENMRDERTSSKEKRKIRIDIVVVPNEERTIANVEYSVTSQIAPLEGGIQTIDLLHDRNLASPENYHPGQVDFRDYQTPQVDEDGVIIE